MSFQDAVLGPIARGSSINTGIDGFSIGGALPMVPIHPSATSSVDIGSLASSFPIKFDVTEPSTTGAVQTVLPTANIYTNAYEWANGYKFMMESEQRYQVLITNKDTEEEDQLLEKPMGQTAIRKNRAVSVPGWNFLQSVTEPMPSTPSDVLTPEACISKYTFKGPVISETGAHVFLREANFGRKRERMYNSGFWGYVPATNIWGEKVRPRTKLFFILKKVETPRNYDINPLGSSPIDSRTFVAKLGGAVLETVTNKPFQLIPWADFEKDEPRKEDLEYTDEFGYRHLGLKILVAEMHDFGSGTPDMGARMRFHPYRDARVASNGTLPVYWIQWKCKI
jgi:hypothetical protein